MAELPAASTDHVVKTAIGYTVGTIATGAALVLAGPVLAPLGAVAAATGLTLPFIGGAFGGWLGYRSADKEAQLKGVRLGR